MNNIIEKQSIVEWESVRFRDLVFPRGVYAALRDNGEIIEFTFNEYTLMMHLMKHPHLHFTGSELCDVIYNARDVERKITPQVVWSVVHQLRRKIGYNYIEYIRGRGYRINSYRWEPNNDE